jgi:hypothetical protein
VVARKDTAHMQSMARSACLMGKYGLMDRKLYLLPRNIHPLMDAMKMDRRHTQAIVKLVIAHELTHALQDQHVGLAGSIDKLRGLDEFQAFEASIEGHACFIQDRVGEMLGISEAALKSAFLFAAGKVDLGDSPLALFAKVIESKYEQVYVGGARFMAWHFKRGGNEKLWKILGSPPRQTSMIARPQSYAPGRRAKVDLADVLDGIAPRFDDRDWSVHATEMGQMMLRAIYGGIERETRERLLAAVTQAQAMKAASGEDLATAGVFLLTGAAEARDLLAAVHAMGARQLKAAKGESLIRFANVREGGFKGLKADAVKSFTFDVLIEDELAAHQRVVRVVRGNAMLELSWTVDTSEEEIAEIVELIFARLAAARKRAAQPTTRPAPKAAGRPATRPALKAGA